MTEVAIITFLVSFTDFLVFIGKHGIGHQKKGQNRRHNSQTWKWQHPCTLQTTASLHGQHLHAKGLHRHIGDMGKRGVTNAEIDQLELSLKVLEQQSAEVEKLRAELAEKVRLQNDTLASVKTSYAELKKTLKGYYPQERWMDYGIPDRR